MSDEDGAVSRAYGALAADATGYPSRISYLIGPTFTVVRVYGTVDPAAHPDEVLADLR